MQNGPRESGMLDVDSSVARFIEDVDTLQEGYDRDSVNIIGGDNKDKETNRARRKLLIESTVDILVDILRSDGVTDGPQIEFFKRLANDHLVAPGLRDLGKAYFAALDSKTQDVQFYLLEVYTFLLRKLRAHFEKKTFRGKNVLAIQKGTGDKVRGLDGLDEELRKLGVARTGSPDKFAATTHTTVYPYRNRRRRAEG